MTTYSDLDFQRKRQFLINLRVQALTLKLIAQTDDIDIKEVIAPFFDRAVQDVDEFSEAEINEQIRIMDKELDAAIRIQQNTICEIRNIKTAGNEMN